MTSRRVERGWARPLVLLGLALVPLAVLGLFFVLPLTGMITRGFRPEGHWEIGGVLDVLGRPTTRRVVWFTVWTSVLATVIAVALGLPAAYTLHRLRFPLRRLIRATLMVPFVLPTVVVGVAFRELLGEGGPLAGLRLDGTPWAILAALVFFNVAVVIRTVGAAWESLDARPGEAASALGAGPWTVFRTVTLPALRPAIVSSASVVFLFCATAFGIVFVLGAFRYRSVETEIYFLTTQLFDLPGAAALSLLQLLAVVVLLAVSARLRAVPDPTAQRARPRPARPTLRDLPQISATLVLLGAVALPIATLVIGSLRDNGHWSLVNYRMLGSPGDGNALLVPVTEAIRLSVVIATYATVLSMALGVLIAVVVTRRARGRVERTARSVLDGLFMLPLGVSAVTLGFGFLVTLNHPPIDFRDQIWLIPVAQALVAMPLVVRTIVPVLHGIDDRQRQAAASLGAGPIRVFLTVDLAALWRPFLAAACFAYAVALGEFGATSFIARPEHPTLPVVIARLLNFPGAHNYGMALASSCVLAAVTAAIMVLVERLHVPSLGTF